MKRFFTWIVAVVAATMLVGCGGLGSSYEDAVSNKAIAVARFDAYQVLQKSGMYEDLLRLLKAQMLDENVPYEFVSIAEDPKNSGIDVEAPMYGFVEVLDINTQYVAAVAKVGDIDKLNNLLRSLELLSEGELKRVVLDGITFVELDRRTAIAYNNVACMIGSLTSRSGYNVQECLSKSLKQTENGSGGELPEFEGSDAALRVNMEQTLTLLKTALSSSYDADAAQLIAQLEPYREMKVDMAMNFTKGSIDYDVKVVDMPTPEMEIKPCSNENLKYVSANAWAVANTHLVGVDVIKALNTAVNKDANLKLMVEKLLREATGGMVNYNAAMAIAEPLISSIDGDITAALNEVKVVEANNDGYSSSEYKVNAVAVANVKNRAIFDQISGMVAGQSEVQRANNDLYTVNIDGEVGFFGQQGESLFASMPSPLVAVSNPATNAPWYADVEDSYGYAVVNLSAILSDYSIRGALEKELRYELGRQGSVYASKYLDMVNYIVFTAPNTESASLRVVFKDKEKNSLQQIVDVVKFDLIRELSR